MKKLVLSVLVLLLFEVSANATMMVTYNVAGAPISYSRGAAPSISPYRMNHMTNRRYNVRPSIHPCGGIRARNYIPQRIGMPPISGMRPLPPMSYRTGNYNYQPKIVYTQNSKPVQPISRFNKNYSINSPKKSYVRNGVTYYN